MEFAELPSIKTLISAAAISLAVWATAIVSFFIY